MRRQASPDRGCATGQGTPFRVRKYPNISLVLFKSGAHSTHMSETTQAYKVTNMAVREKCENRCANCGVEDHEAVLDVHHIVPRGQGGSNLMSNQTVLCRRCHDAAHGKKMAPTVQSASTGMMDSETFELYRQFWRNILPQMGEMCNVSIQPIYVGEEQCWHIAEADMRLLMGSIEMRV